jgi:hypothetical protein
MSAIPRPQIEGHPGLHERPGSQAVDRPIPLSKHFTIRADNLDPNRIAKVGIIFNRIAREQ